MAFSVARVIEDMSNEILPTRSFDERWVVITRTLSELGATAVNAAAINAETLEPVWFRSTLGAAILSAYVSDGHHLHDLIVRHAVEQHSPLVWNTGNGQFRDVTGPEQNFAEFVVDSGYQSIVSHSMIGRSKNDVRTLVFCSQHKPCEVLEPTHLKQVQLVLNFLLPWVGWPEHQNHPEFVRAPSQRLSRREVEALSCLAGGFQNARIAEAMGISEATVAKHLLTARQKLGARTREQAIAIAIREGMITP